MNNEITKSAIEILLLYVCFYYVVSFMYRTRGAGVLKGLLFLTMIAFIFLAWFTSEFGLFRIRAILQWFLSASVFALIIIFQPELRGALIKIGQNPILRPFFRGHAKVLDEVVSAVIRMAKNRVGALIAIQRDVGLGAYVEGGVKIDADVSAEIIESIFYPGSTLHDGAIIIQNERIAAAGCLFPLTDNPEVARSMGTRHRAGIGITEETDAVTIIVSEENGKVSLGARGKLTTDLDRESLLRSLQQLCLVDRKGAGSGKDANPGEV